MNSHSSPFTLLLSSQASARLASNLKVELFTSTETYPTTEYYSRLLLVQGVVRRSVTADHSGEKVRFFCRSLLELFILRCTPLTFSFPLIVRLPASCLASLPHSLRLCNRMVRPTLRLLRRGKTASRRQSTPIPIHRPNRIHDP
jgi:hypothetical protein